MPSRVRARPVVLACVALLALHAVVAWTAARTKCSTVDEPMHAAVAWLAWHRGDFRNDTENPALWHRWIALPQGTAVRSAEFTEQDWQDTERGAYPPFAWAKRTL